MGAGVWRMGGTSKMDVVEGLRRMGKMKETWGRWINGDEAGGTG